MTRTRGTQPVLAGAVAAAAVGAAAAALVARLSRGPRAGQHPREATIDLRAILRANASRPRTDAFTGGRVLTVLGAAHLDLAEATVVDGAVLRVVTVGGATRVTVPPWVRLVVLGEGRLGGHDATGPGVDDGDPSVPTLFVEASTWVGGLGIRTVAGSAGHRCDLRP